MPQRSEGPPTLTDGGEGGGGTAPRALARPDLLRAGEWRGDRVVEGTRLESERALTGTVGSNPTLSAVKLR